jgi:DNA-binding GntR family transcriptional regulator
VRQSEPRRHRAETRRTEAQLVFRTKGQAVYEQLRDWIVHGKLSPGEAVDQERLAEMLNVSRMPLRQALLQLEGDRLIARKPHHTAIVTSLSVSDIDDIYGARSVLEGLLAEKGAAVFDEDLFAQLTALSIEIAEAVARTDNESFVALDRSFHMSLYQVSGCPRTIEILERLRNAAERYMHAYVPSKPTAPQSQTEHEAILAAYRAGDQRLVRKLTEEHVARSAAELRQLADSASLGAARSATDLPRHRLTRGAGC